jgi:hypothetical protein
MVNTSADDADTMIGDEPTVLPTQGQEIPQHTPWPQPPVPAPRPQTPEPSPRPRTPETHTLSGLVFLGHMMPQKPPQRRQLCEKLRQPETPRMLMWSSSYLVNWQVATVSPMSLSQMSLSQMSLSRMSLSQMSLSRMSLSRMSLSRMSLSRMSLSLMSLSLMSRSLMSLSLRHAWMAR